MSQVHADRPPATSDESLSTAVVEAVAREEGVAPHRLDAALYDAVDPDALDALFVPRNDGSQRAEGSITFAFAGYEVTATADGTVALAARA